MVPEKKHPGRRLLAFLSGMRFSIVLLALIIAGCAAGSVIPQGNPQALTGMFGSVGAAVLTSLALDRVFTAPWFTACAVLLCLNLVLCSVLRFPAVLRRCRRLTDPKRIPRAESASFSIEGNGQRLDLKALGARKTRTWTDEEGKTWQGAASHAAGFWGSWLCHLGILLVIIGFAAGQHLSREWVVYGIPGSEQPIGDSGCTLRIDDFQVDLREDFTVRQYEASLTVKKGQESIAGKASVNHPMSAFGMNLYQDSTGWANWVDIEENGEKVKTDLICAGEYTWPEDAPQLVFLLNKFYPDFVSEGGELYSRTPLLENPRSLYSVFYQDRMLTMNVAEMNKPVQVERYAFTLYDPVQYTLIVARRDPTAWLVGLAALVLLAGLLLAFYVRPQEIWTDGETLYARTEKAPALLEASLRTKMRQAGVLKEGDKKDD